jgi:N-acetylneuraminic acid mutarotase
MKNFIIILILSFLTTFAFSQTQNYWTKKADFAGLKRERAVAFDINGKGYIGTGVDTTDVVKNDFWEYDPVLNTWTQKADIIGVARRNAIAFSINDKGYLGTGMDHSEAGLGSTLSDFMEFDPISNTWVNKASFPGSSGTGVYFATGFSADSKGYICGGKRGPNNYTNEFWEYKPLTDAWSQRENFPGGVRYQLSSFVIDNLAYVGLGIDQDVYRKDLWMYNPATNVWYIKNDFLGGERGAACTFTLGQRGFVSTGSDGGFKNDLWEYNPFDDSWSVRANFDGSERKNAVAFSVNGKAYLGTGKGVSGKKMSFYEYTPYCFLTLESADTDVRINVYPNPISDYLKIDLSKNTKFSISIFSLNGQLVYDQFTSGNNLEINCNMINSGVYILQLNSTDNVLTYTQQIIIQK